MILCEKCKSKYKYYFPMHGDGDCSKHGRFGFNRRDLKIPCGSCAQEQNKCQLCGRELIEKKG